MPLISIIIPIYKAERYLNMCIESVVNQTYKHIEIILVDDGSPDSCPTICDEWSKKDSRIIVIHKKNGGVSTARNAALDIVNGEYITFVDSDDTIDERLIEILYTRLVQNQVDCSVCNMNIVTESSTNAKKTSETELILDKNEMIKEILSDGITAGFVWGKMFKKEFIQGLHFEENIHFMEDQLFVIQVLLNCENVVFTPEPLYNYFQRCDSVTQSGFNEKICTSMLAIDKMKKILKDANNLLFNEMLCVRQLEFAVLLLQYFCFETDRKIDLGKNLQKKVRENITLKRLKKIGLFVRIDAILISINLNLFLLEMKLKKLIKG
ncbi:MAG: glycosyltransferase [Clostridia bacterium]|nr:glycosyltransferase [Clostridia bacterium]